MKLRYIGPDDPDGVELVCSGVSYGVVQVDGVVEVPDDVYKAHSWSSDLWAEVAPAKKQQKEATTGT